MEKISLCAYEELLRIMYSPRHCRKFVQSKSMPKLAKYVPKKWETCPKEMENKSQRSGKHVTKKWESCHKEMGKLAAFVASKYRYFLYGEV